MLVSTIELAKWIPHMRFREILPILHKFYAVSYKHTVRMAKLAALPMKPADPQTYLIFVIFLTREIFLENIIYTEIYTVNCQFTQ